MCHMVKLMHNRMADNGILVDSSGREIKWSYNESLEKLQRQQGLRAGNKLHEQHVQQKIKVKLAQTLSASIANAHLSGRLETTAVSGICDATVEFIRNVHRLFRLVNR